MVEWVAAQPWCDGRDLGRPWSLPARTSSGPTVSDINPTSSWLTVERDTEFMSDFELPCARCSGSALSVSKEPVLPQ